MPEYDLHTIEVAKACVWTADLQGLKRDHEALEQDIEQMLARRYRNAFAYGQQTSTELHELRAPHWKRFFSGVRSVIESVVASSPAMVDQGTVHLRAWASKLGGQGSYSDQHLRLNALHNHWPAFLSSVYYLRIPGDVDSAEAGTFFVNPFPHSLAAPHPGVAIPAVEGRLVVFPSWFMHGPLILRPSHASLRLVIAVDVHLIPM